MDSENKIGRRKFLVLSGSLTAIAAVTPGFSNSSRAKAAGVPEYGELDRFTLDLGYRAPRSGPITALKNGDLLWITTDPEAPYLSKSMWSISRLAMRRSTDGGKSWSDAQILQHGTKDFSVMSFGLFCLKSGEILHVFARSSGYDYETGTPEKSLREIFFQHSTNNGKIWSVAQKMLTGERYHGDVLSLEQLRDGRIIYPFCFLTNVKSQFAVSAMYSDDDGKNWKRSPSVLRTGGGGFESGASEPTVVELPDGKLWMLIRAQTGFLWESFSTDRGQTWSSAQSSILPSSNAPATALKLKSGEIAVAWNNHIQANYARQSLVVGITNDGKTFKGLREIDFTDFTDDPNSSIPHVTYSYLTETKDGSLAISYNKGNWSRHNRPTFAKVNKEWILAKEDFADLSSGRTGWHTIDPGAKASAAVERYILENDKLWLEIEQSPRNKETTGIVRNIPLVKDGVIQFTVQATKSESYILFGNSLLSPRNADEGCLRIRFGTNKIYLAVGRGNRSQNNRRTTEYRFLSHTIKDEVEYPLTFKANEILNISVRFQAGISSAEISINQAAPVKLQTDKILGLTFVGLLVANGGQIRLQSIKTTLK